MKYSVLKRTNSANSDTPGNGLRLLVVARDRIDALNGIIGPHEEIAQVRGATVLSLFPQ